jgi:hypothetical protein
MSFSLDAVPYFDQMQQAIEASVLLESARHFEEESTRKVAQRENVLAERILKSQTAEPHRGEVVKAEGAKRDINLVKLSILQREATFGTGQYYSEWFHRMCASYHQGGDEWSDDRLQRFFVEGLLRHYIGEEIAYDFTYNYEMWGYPEYRIEYTARSAITGQEESRREDHEIIPTYYDRTKFAPIAIVFNLDLSTPIQNLVPYARILGQYLKELSENKTLLKLGGDFQKQKVVTEKMETALENLR